MVYELDQCFTSLMEHNALPPKYQDMMDHVELAVAVLDESLYHKLSNFFGRASFKISKIDRVTKDNYLIVLE